VSTPDFETLSNFVTISCTSIPTPDGLQPMIG